MPEKASNPQGKKKYKLVSDVKDNPWMNKFTALPANIPPCSQHPFLCRKTAYSLTCLGCSAIALLYLFVIVHHACQKGYYN